MKINFGRVLLGGLLTGLILNIGEWLLNDKVLATEMHALFRKCGVPLPGTTFIVIAVVITFVLGIVIVAGYAAIRPRFGPGPKTANAALGFTPTNVLMILLGWEVVEFLLATLAGAWLYREA